MTALASHRQRLFRELPACCRRGLMKTHQIGAGINIPDAPPVF